MSERKLTDEQIKKILECFGINEKQMIDTKQMAKHIFEEYADCYSEVDIKNLAKYLDGIKAEAIKEFAERLKEKIRDVAKMEFQNDYYYLIGEPFIDNIVEEMEGDKND